VVVLVVLGGVLGLSGAAAAAPDTKGTDYWLMFTQNLFPENLSLLVTSDVETSGTVAIPGLGVSSPFSVAAGGTTSVSIPLTAEVTASDELGNLGIHVTAGAEVTVYGLSKGTFSSGAYLGLPTDVLGTEHVVLGYRNGGVLAGSHFGIVATQNATSVTITPSVTVGSRVADVPYMITMNAGQTYLLREGSTATGDLSGSIVASDKPVAVFGGHTCANIPPNFGFCDQVVEQLPPTNAWGERFVAVPIATRLNGDTFRFVAAVNGTTVSVNGTSVATLNRGDVHEQVVSEAAVIESSQPILVGQYSNGREFDAVLADPFMMLIPPTEQLLAEYTITTPPASTGFGNFLNVVARTSSAGSILVDGVAIPAAAFSPIGASGYSGAQVPVIAGPHHLEGPLPFGVHVYGLAPDDSYGYPGGGSISPVADVATLTLTPETATNFVNTQHCVTAAVADDGAGPLEGIRVDFAVTGTHTRSGFGFTGANGQTDFCYTGTIVGDDEIVASVGSLTDTATKTWNPEPPRPTVLSLTPEDATNTVNTEHCVTATVTDQNGAAFAGAAVDFAVTGVNPGTGTGTTGENGQAGFCYTGTVVGDDLIRATSGALTDTATKTWTPEPPRPTALSLTPEEATNTVNTEHCVTATVTDQNGAPFDGAAVDFAVTGVNPGTGSGTTGENGQAGFCYTGTSTGDDLIRATSGQLTDTATKTWNPEPPRPTALSLTPETATNTVGTEHCVTATVTDQNGAPFGAAAVDFVVTGANPRTGSGSTGQNGQSEFCYTGTSTGDDLIRATSGQLTDTATKTWNPVAPQVGAALLVLDEESLSGKPFKGKAGERERSVLPYFAEHVGETLTVKTGQSGDEGWYAPNCIPAKWVGGSSNACLEGAQRETAIDNFFGANGSSAVPSQSRLDKIPAVMPLRALGLTSLIGEDVCAVVYESDVSVNYNTSSFPFTDANLQGKALGVVAFRVDAVTWAKKSSSTLPQMTLTILDASVCGDWVLFNAPVPGSSSEPNDTRADRPVTSIGGKGYRQLRARPEKDLFY
jgi:protocatechuate 3,4-dioxygenase beta subunit